MLARMNVSQNELARRAGISSGYMSQLLSQIRCAGPATREKLLQVLPGIDFDNLFNEVRN